MLTADEARQLHACRGAADARTYQVPAWGRVGQLLGARQDTAARAYQDGYAIGLFFWFFGSHAC